MNWGLIGWFAGAVLTFAGLKFVWVFLRSILSKDNMEDVIDSAAENISNAGKKFGNYLKKKEKERKIRKKQMKQENKPIVTIR